MNTSITVISLCFSERRGKYIADALNGHGRLFNYFDAVDGSNETLVNTSFVCKKEFFSPAYRFREAPISKGELACTLSHMFAIRNHFESGKGGRLLIFEDDALSCDQDLEIVDRVIKQVPDNAATIQFALTPPKTIDALGHDFCSNGQLYIPKVGPCSLNSSTGLMPCHCTAAYLITEAGIHQISTKWFEEDKIVFPCDRHLISHNAALLADQLVYQAATSNGATAYACSVPLFTTAAEESTLHPTHIEGHKLARDTALRWNKQLMPYLEDCLNQKTPRI